jgi:hypothetical protein
MSGGARRVAPVAFVGVGLASLSVLEVVMKKLVATVGAVVLSVPVAALAAFDTAPIDAVKADMLTAAGALLGLGVAVWGALKIVRMFHGR